MSSGSDRPRRLGSRVVRLRASHSFRPVLLSILVTLVFGFSAPDDVWARALTIVLLCTTLLLALWTAGIGGDRRVPLIAISVSAAAIAAEISGGGSTRPGIAALVSAALVLATAATIGIGVVDQEEVNEQSVTGAVCVYLLIGILFASVFGTLAYLGTGPFFAQGMDGSPSLRLYFSYVTLATLGYGDYTPAGNLGHTFAVFEALLGQLYLVTVVAVLVSKLGRRERKTQEDSRGRRESPTE